MRRLVHIGIVHAEASERSQLIAALSLAGRLGVGWSSVDELYSAALSGKRFDCLVLPVPEMGSELRDVASRYLALTGRSAHPTLPVLGIVRDDRRASDLLTEANLAGVIRAPISPMFVCDMLDTIEAQMGVNFPLDSGQIEEPDGDLRTILDSLGVGVVAILPDGTVHFANRSAVLSLGMEATFENGIPLSKLFGEHAANTILHMPVAGILAARELPIKAPRGSLPIECTIAEMRLSNGAHGGRIVLFRDLTQQHRLEEAVHMFSRSILDSLYSGVVTVDLDGRIEFMNRAARDLLGDSSESAIGFPLAKLTGDEVAQQMLNGDVEQRPWMTHEIEFEVDYRRVQIGYSISHRTDRRGRKAGTVIHFRDISLVKHLQEERIKHERLISMEVLASALAHDIRNPLASISGVAQLVALRSKDDTTANELLGRITSQVQRLNRLFESFFSAIRADRGTPSAAPVSKALVQAKELMMSRITAKRINFSIEDSYQATVFCNSDQLLQIVLNLLVHQIESTLVDGNIEVVIEPFDETLAPVEERYFQLESIRNEYTDGGIVIRFAASGSALPPEVLQRLFDPFFRAEAGGSDIGLFAVQRLVQKNRGAIVPYRSGDMNRIAILLPSVAPGTPTASEEPSK